MRELGRAAAVLMLLAATSAGAQSHDHGAHDMPGHRAADPQPPQGAPDHAGHGDPAAPDPHAGHDMPAADPHAGHVMPADTPGTAPPPPVPDDHAADRLFPVARMAAARAVLSREGRFIGGAVQIDQLEYRAASGAEGYAWQASAWYGGDNDRVMLKTEGEGAIGHAPKHAEVQLLWRRAIDPWFDLSAGLRHNFRPTPQRTYLALGIEGLAPYWIDVEGQAFLSDRGDVHLRLGAGHDLRLAGPLVLRAEAELDASLQDVAALGIAAGPERLELGARLRYEIRPELAPYLGLHWERKLGGTADLARAQGERGSSLFAVVGLKTWF